MPIKYRLVCDQAPQCIAHIKSKHKSIVDRFVSVTFLFAGLSLQFFSSHRPFNYFDNFGLYSFVCTIRLLIIQWFSSLSICFRWSVFFTCTTNPTKIPIASLICYFIAHPPHATNSYSNLAISTTRHYELESNRLFCYIFSFEWRGKSLPILFVAKITLYAHGGHAYNITYITKCIAINHFAIVSIFNRQ